MNQTYLLAVGALGALATAAYLYLPEQRVPVSSTTAFLSWGYVALSGGGATTVTDSGTVVDVPLPDELRLLATALSIVSFFALVFALLGVYPPEAEGESDDASERFTFD